jgi:hypothetical protein
MPSNRKNQISAEDSDSSVKSEGSKRLRESPTKENKGKRVKTTRVRMTDKTQINSQQFESLMDQIKSIATMMEPLRRLEQRFDELDDKIHNLNENVNRMDDNLKSMNEKLTESNKRVFKLEKNVAKLMNENDMSKITDNQIQQKLLSNQFVIFGLPSFDNKTADQIIYALSEKSGVNFDKSDLKKFYATKTRTDSNKCVVHGEFYSEKIKNQFLLACFEKKPIVVEDIVTTLKRSDKRRGTEIYVKSQLTPMNRELSLEARRQRLKGNFKYAWERDGRILVKQDDGGPTIEIKSMEQMMTLVNKKPHQSSSTQESLRDDEAMSSEECN